MVVLALNCLLRDDLPTLCFLATSVIERTVPALKLASAASIDPVGVEKSRVEDVHEVWSTCKTLRNLKHQ